MNSRWRSEKYSHTWTDEQRQLQAQEDRATAAEVEWWRQKYLEAVFKQRQLTLPLEFTNEPFPPRRTPSS